MSDSKDDTSSMGVVSKEWLDTTFATVGEVIAESVKAGVECGSFGLQLMPNAFEVSQIVSTGSRDLLSFSRRILTPRFSVLTYCYPSPDSCHPQTVCLPRG